MSARSAIDATSRPRRGVLRRNLTTLALGGLLAVVLAGCGAVAHMTITPASPHWSAQAALGEKYFNTPHATKSFSTISCADCHTLAADPKATGTIGPDLDGAFGPDRCQDFSVSTIQDVVRGQIAYADNDPETDWPPVPLKLPNGTVEKPQTVEGMPPNLVTGKEARDIATYVAATAGMTEQQTGGKAPYWDCATGEEVTASST